MFIVATFIISTGLVVIAEANLRCGGFLSEKKCRHSAGSFSFFLVLTTRHSLSFHTFERQRCLFGVDNALFYLLLVPGSAPFLISVFSVESCLFMCLSVMRFFSLQVFPFLISVWLILSFWCVPFYSFVQFYWGSGRCTSEFALECFCLNKVVTNW